MVTIELKVKNDLSRCDKVRCALSLSAIWKFYKTPIFMKQPLLIIGIVVLSMLQLTAQEDGSKYSNEFLSIGISAKAQALGNAVTANVDDVTAGYWNPAGLINLNNNESVGLQIGGMHAEWFAGVGQYDYVGITMPISNGKSRLGLSYIRFAIDNIPNTLSLFEDDGTINYDNIVSFSAADNAVLLSYATSLKTQSNGRLNVGGNVKIVRRIIGSFADSWGFGLDLGAQYQKNNWRFGLMARDITTTFNAWSFNFTEEEKQVLTITGNDVPISSVEITRPQVLLGLGYVFDFGIIKARPEVDVIATTDGRRNTLLSANPISIDPAAGIEVEYNNYLFLRAGVNQFQRESDLDRVDFLTARGSVGIGIKLSNLTVDYAFTDLGDQRNTYSHVISLMLDIKPKE